MRSLCGSKSPYLILLFFVILVAGCASSKAIDNAQVVIEKARLAHADYLAPYDFASAELYLAEAKSQRSYSDFSAAVKFAKTSLAHAQSAYNIALEKQSSTPISKTEAFTIESIVLSRNPKEILRENIERAKNQLATLEAAGAKTCAPKEFAAAKANLSFCIEEWEERDYNKSANHLRVVKQMVELALPFMDDCKNGAVLAPTGKEHLEK